METGADLRSLSSPGRVRSTDTHTRRSKEARLSLRPKLSKPVPGNAAGAHPRGRIQRSCSSEIIVPTPERFAPQGPSLDSTGSRDSSKLRERLEYVKVQKKSDGWCQSESRPRRRPAAASLIAAPPISSSGRVSTTSGSRSPPAAAAPGRSPRTQFVRAARQRFRSAPRRCPSPASRRASTPRC